MSAPVGEDAACCSGSTESLRIETSHLYKIGKDMEVAAALRSR